MKGYKYDCYSLNLSKEGRKALDFLISIGIDINAFLNREMEFLRNYFVMTMVDGKIDENVLQQKKASYERELKERVI